MAVINRAEVKLIAMFLEMSEFCSCGTINVHQAKSLEKPLSQNAVARCFTRFEHHFCLHFSSFRVPHTEKYLALPVIANFCLMDMHCYIDVCYATCDL